MQGCIPWDLQEYFYLPVAGLPGAWLNWNFGVGGSGSGASFHFHAEAINILTAGYKRWYIWPPIKSFYSTQPLFNWLRDNYTFSTKRSQSKVQPVKENEFYETVFAPIEFVQRPGEIVILPKWVGHATACLGECLSLSRVIQSPMNLRARKINGPFENSRFTPLQHQQIMNLRSRLQSLSPHDI